MTSVPATRPTAQATTTFSTAHFLLEALTGKVVDIVGHIASTLAAFDEKLAAGDVSSSPARSRRR